MVSICLWLQISTTNNFAFLYHKISTSIKLILVFWVHFGDELFTLEGTINYSRFLYIYTNGFMYELGLTKQYLLWKVEGA